MKKGPLNEALADIVELDRQARDLVHGPVVRLDDVRAQYRYLRSLRRDKVRVIEASGK
jgi:hypothetical protein